MRAVPVLNCPHSACLLLLALLAPWFALGQEQEQKAHKKAAISGTVTDQTGAVVTGASVVLSNATGFRQETQSDEKGAYLFTGLEAGT